MSNYYEYICAFCNYKNLCNYKFRIKEKYICTKCKKINIYKGRNKNNPRFNYKKYKRKMRSLIKEELIWLPPRGYFPGGLEYQNGLNAFINCEPV